MRILVTGGRGFLGKHLVSALESRGHDVIAPAHFAYELEEELSTRLMFSNLHPEVVVHAAAFVGGIGLNQQRPAEMFVRNMRMGINVCDAANRASVKKLVFVGSACSYPLEAIPAREDELWSGYPEPTNAAYGVSKRALVEMLKAYRSQYDFNAVSVILTNLYGPGESLDPQKSHMVGALVRKILEAKASGAESVEIWGSGRAMRDLLYVEDAAEAICRVVESYNLPEPLNIGTGIAHSVETVAETIKFFTEYDGKFVFDRSRPDGQPKRLMDVSRIKNALAWEPKYSLPQGIERMLDSVEIPA